MAATLGAFWPIARSCWWLRGESITSVNDCSLIEFPKIANGQGSLSFVEGSKHIPFEPKRVFYVYDLPSGARRGGHAHRELQQVLICLSGSLDVVIDDGIERKTVHMDKPNVGLFMPKCIWAEIIGVVPNTVYMVLASSHYREDDYIRDYNRFKQHVQEVVN